MAFKTGTVVQLKSGGPEMTIKGIIGDKNSPLNQTEETGLKLGGYENGDVYCDRLQHKLADLLSKNNQKNKIL